ncbi:MAG: DUF3842 family protein [Desulfobacterales bacterium]|nr:DUF3842 family protein [Desulfobacterales bacterium]
MQKTICIIDGQGGSIGAVLIRYIRAEFKETVQVIAIGTNAIATAQMLKAGANRGATGETPICRAAPDADVIMGPIAITWANAMLGEVTPKMAEAVTSSLALKILLPLNQEKVRIVGVAHEPLPHLVQAAIEKELKKELKEEVNHV